MTQPPPQAVSADAEDLARRAQAGSAPCFASLVALYQVRLLNFLVRRTRCRADAEDLTQETFVRAWQKIGSYNPSMRFSTWLFTIGSRLASNHRRDRRREGGGLSAEPVIESDPGGPAQMLEGRRQVWSLVDRVLTEPQRSAIYLRYVEGLEPAEIARVLGKSGLGTRVLLFRARDRLARAMAGASAGAASAPDAGSPLRCPQSLGGVS